jgi:hypothetical protein
VPAVGPAYTATLPAPIDDSAASAFWMSPRLSPALSVAVWPRKLRV